MASEPCSSSPTIGVSRSSTATTSAWTIIPPFDQPDQLCADLQYPLPKSETRRLLHSINTSQTLPDAPRVTLASGQIVSYCLDDLDTASMNKLDEKLFHANPSMTIRPLTDQLTNGRQLQASEDVSLHCLWSDNIVFVKPLPSYLCSHAFWEYILDNSTEEANQEERERLRATCLGFLRTYAQMIQRRSDFIAARKHDLLNSFEKVTFEELVAFLISFDNIPDSAVSPRWRYGEINLNALNFHSILFLRKWHRNRYEFRYGAYFSRFFPVVLFMFALFSVALNGMQVILGAEQLKPTDNDGLRKTLGGFTWFGTEAISWSAGFGLVFVVWWVGISSNEAWKRRKLHSSYKKKQKEEGTLPP